MRLCAAAQAQCLALQAMLPATCVTLFSSASLLHVYRMGLFPGACCWLALVRNSTAWRMWRILVTVLISVVMAEQKAPMAWLGLARVCVERQHLPQNEQSSLYGLIRGRYRLRSTSKCQSRLKRSHFAGRMPCSLPRELQGQVEGNSVDHSNTPF